MDVRPLQPIKAEQLYNFELALRFIASRFSGTFAGFDSEISNLIERRTLLPSGAVGQLVGGQPIIRQDATGAVFISLSNSAVFVRTNAVKVRLRGVEGSMAVKLRSDLDREQSGLVFHNLGKGTYLVQIEVHESSYQPRYIFMHYAESSGKPARLLKLKTYERDDDEAGTISTKVLTEVEGLPAFDAAKKQLVFYTKGRGTGDCGSLVKYSITPTRAIPSRRR